MKSFTGKIASGRGWVPLLALLLGAGMMISACGDEETPAPTTPTPAPPPPPAPAPEPEPTGPATPENLRVTGTTSSSITWSWNAVEGALGYQGQFSPDTTFTDADPTFIIVAPATSHTVSNLSSNMTGHFRVRAGTGTALTDLTYSDWTSSESGSTSAPPAAVPLAAPGSVSTSSVLQTSITVSWSSVDDADHYEVQQQAEGGSWVDASCGGADNEVDGTQCAAGNLERGTRYDFRVRAVPASSNTANTASDWSTSGSVSTAGTAAREPVTGGDDELSITWESDETSITWFWDAATDTRITNLYVVLTPTANERPACPALNDTTNAWQTNMPYAIAHNVTGLTAGGGDVRGLCVRRIWMDDDDNIQYGPASISWAATAPKAGTAPAGDGRITAGVKEESAKTTAIDWFVEMDKGFDYPVRTISATVGTSLPSCTAGSGSTVLSGSMDGETERFRLSTLTTYTQYAACVRATDDSNASTWTELTTYSTLPAAPSSLRNTMTTSTAATAVTATLGWSFTGSDTMPENPGDYVANVYHVTYTSATDPRPTLTGATCDSPPSTPFTSAPGQTVSETGSGFALPDIEVSLTRADSTATASSTTHTILALACVRAHLPNAETRVGPWRSLSTTRTVSVPRQQ